ncbi:hypothetical protein G6F65_021976 [Rhizopus arrhizus]|nr:hypothetical protein G6F65_021976 [Rhizopus arrhizus]
MRFPYGARSNRREYRQTRKAHGFRYGYTGLRHVHHAPDPISGLVRPIDKCVVPSSMVGVIHVRGGVGRRPDARTAADDRLRHAS